jgi:hypothetical protein
VPGQRPTVNRCGIQAAKAFGKKRLRHPLICIKSAAGFRAILVGNSPKGQEVAMSEKIKSEMISRRGAFMLLGSAAAFSVAVPVTIMTATDAEARVGNPGSAVSVAGANRRDRRQDRRYKNTKSPTTTTPTTTGQGEKK